MKNVIGLFKDRISELMLLLNKEIFTIETTHYIFKCRGGTREIISIFNKLTKEDDFLLLSELKDLDRRLNLLESDFMTSSECIENLIK